MMGPVSTFQDYNAIPAARGGPRATSEDGLGAVQVRTGWSYPAAVDLVLKLTSELRDDWVNRRKFEMCSSVWKKAALKILRSLGVMLLATGFLTPSHADSPYPSRPVQIVVPYPPGGLTDLLTRAVADRLTK